MDREEELKEKIRQKAQRDPRAEELERLRKKKALEKGLNKLLKI